MQRPDDDKTPDTTPLHRVGDDLNLPFSPTQIVLETFDASGHLPRARRRGKHVELAGIGLEAISRID